MPATRNPSPEAAMIAFSCLSLDEPRTKKIGMELIDRPFRVSDSIPAFQA
jgi:hypothetical protein